MASEELEEIEALIWEYERAIKALMSLIVSCDCAVPESDHHQRLLARQIYELRGLSHRKLALIEKSLH